MIAVTDSTNIVLAGRWNLGIFTPQWVTQTLFQLQETRVEFSFDPNRPFRYIGSSVAFVPSASRVILAPQLLDEETLVRSERLATRLLHTLPHTPVSGVGINFRFSEQEPPPELLDHFPDPDSTSFASAGVEVKSRSFRRDLRFTGQTIKLTAEVQGASVVFDFNFHTDVTEAEAGAVALDGRVVGHRATALDLLHTIYGLQLEES